MKNMKTIHVDGRPNTVDGKETDLAMSLRCASAPKQSLRRSSQSIDCFVGLRPPRNDTAPSFLAMIRFFVVTLSLLTTVFCLPSTVFAEDKSWTGSGDGADWFDAANWLPAVAPTASDDATIDVEGADVSLPQAFEAKSITLGGKKQSSLTVSNFATGTVEPANATDLAFHNRRDGLLVLKGSTGKITLKGAYKDSEEVIPDEPSFMFYVQ